MNARTGATNKPGKNTAGFPADRLEKYRLPFPTLRKKPYREKGCKNRNGQPERIYGLAVSAE